MKADRPLTYDRVISALGEHFPQLRDAIADLDGEGVHVVFGFVVNQGFLNPTLDEQDLPNAQTREMFAFIEEMSTSEDAAVRNVVQVTICESLGDSPQRLRRARKLMGPATLALSHEAERFLGRE